MPAFQKRAAKTADDFLQPKKAKKAVVEDPVQTKVAIITARLQDSTFEVPGPKSNRDMLIAMVPSILATPRDQRHAHMEGMIENFKEVFANEEARLSTEVANTEASRADASGNLASRNAEVETAASELQVKVDELKVQQVALAESVGVTRNAEATLKETQFELGNLQETKSDLAQEREVAQARMETFSMFKAGNQDSGAPKEELNLLKTLAAFLKKIKADVSLVAALPMALGRRPEDRSDFDAMTVVELEKRLTEKLSEIAAEVQSNEASIAEKFDFKATSETALIAAKEKQRAAAEVMLAVKAEQKVLTANLSTKKEAVIEQTFVVKALESEYTEKLWFLQAHQGTQSTLMELVERVTPVEPVAEVITETPAVEVSVMEEETLQAVPATVQDVAMSEA